MTARIVAVGRIQSGDLVGLDYEPDDDDFEDPDLWRKTQIEDDMGYEL